MIGQQLWLTVVEFLQKTCGTGFVVSPSYTTDHESSSKEQGAGRLKLELPQLNFEFSTLPPTKSRRNFFEMWNWK